MRKQSGLDKLLIYVALLAIGAGFLLPFAWMVSTSLKTSAQVRQPGFVPSPVMASNYAAVFAHPNLDFVLYTRNTLLIALLTVIGMTASSAIVAYGFARINFRGRGGLFALMLATMMVPFPVTMTPLFCLYRWMDQHSVAWLGPDNWLRILGTFKPLWLPAWFGSAFSIFLLRQFFATIPAELSEAARLDGCGELAIFWRIILPLARPALATVALFSFMGAWNDFLGPLVFIQRPEQYTLALGLLSFQSQHGGTEWNLLMAASVMVCLPIVVLFFISQKTFVTGIATTGGK